MSEKTPTKGSKHEPVLDPLLSLFARNVSVSNSTDIHPSEGSSNNALDISKAKGYDTSFNLHFVLACVCIK